MGPHTLGRSCWATKGRTLETGNPSNSALRKPQMDVHTTERWSRRRWMHIQLTKLKGLNVHDPTLAHVATDAAATSLTRNEIALRADPSPALRLHAKRERARQPVRAASARVPEMLPGRVPRPRVRDAEKGGNGRRGECAAAQVPLCSPTTRRVVGKQPPDCERSALRRADQARRHLSCYSPEPPPEGLRTPISRASDPSAAHTKQESMAPSRHTSVLCSTAIARPLSFPMQVPQMALS